MIKKIFLSTVMILSLGAMSVPKGPLVKVMVIDTGFDATNSIFSVYLDTNDLKDHPDDYTDSYYTGHGTHVAGTVIKDICPEVLLYSCKYFTGHYASNVARLNMCLQRAKTMGMDIVNYSGGGFSPNEPEFKAIKDLSEAGIYVITAAGNRDQDPYSGTYSPLTEVRRIPQEKMEQFFTFINCQQTEYHKTHKNECKHEYKFTNEELDAIRKNYYPAGYDFKFVIPIGSKVQEKISDFSNAGDVQYENGEDVESVLPYNNHGKMSGTSQATAIRTNKILKGICELRGYK